jgi:hypothetical protein
VNIKKRNGKVDEGRELEYLDVRFRDDSGNIGGKIQPWDYKKWGENFPEEGAHVMVRAKFFNGIRYAFVQKWRRIDE